MDNKFKLTPAEKKALRPSLNADMLLGLLALSFLGMVVVFSIIALV